MLVLLLLLLLLLLRLLSSRLRPLNHPEGLAAVVKLSGLEVVELELEPGLRGRLDGLESGVAKLESELESELEVGGSEGTMEDGRLRSELVLLSSGAKLESESGTPRGCVHQRRRKASQGGGWRVAAVHRS